VGACGGLASRRGCVRERGGESGGSAEGRAEGSADASLELSRSGRPFPHPQLIFVSFRTRPRAEPVPWVALVSRSSAL